MVFLAITQNVVKVKVMLSFADDILVFSDGKPSSSSIESIVQIFRKFDRISRMNINTAKSSIFTAYQDEARAIKVSLSEGITRRELPI